MDSLMGKQNVASQVVTRFAPSPTGDLHVGGVRSALFSYLFARQHGGSFVLRIEDTDRERSRKEYEADILAGIEWLGLQYDGLYRQSERVAIHRRYIETLLERDLAYVSEEDASVDGKRSSVIRFRNPGTVVTFNDLIRGDVTFDTAELGDFVVAKDLETPLFHLTVVVDDHEMGITHVIRGEDHISNTPRQILIQEALSLYRPQYAHLPLVLGSDRSKLSKRHGAQSVNAYREEGYLPDAMVNFLVLIGWNPGTDEELFTLAELVDRFRIDQVQKGGAVFNIDKLNWINKKHIERLSEEDRVAYTSTFLTDATKHKALYSDERLRRAVPILLERVSHFGELRRSDVEGEYDYLFDAINYDADLLVWRKEPNVDATLVHLEKIAEIIKAVHDDFSTPDEAKASVWEYAETEGRGAVLWPLRVALTGRERSADPFSTMYILGKEEVLRRLEAALEALRATVSV